jgi:hypothetical protein
MTSLGPLPAPPVPSPRPAEALALGGLLLVVAVAGMVAAFAWSTTAGGALLVVAGLCFFALYARGHLARLPDR